MTVAVAIWGVLENPALKERRYRRLPPVQLIRQAQGGSVDPLLLYLAGYRLNEMGRFAEADPLLHRAAELRPGEARIRDEWAKAQTAEGKLSEAYSQLQDFVSTHPDDADGHLLLGKFYLATHTNDRAIAELERAIALDPGLAEAWSALVHLYSTRKNDPAAAMHAAERAVALRPESPDYRLQLATLLDQQGKESDARYQIESALPHLTTPTQRILCARFLLRTGQAADRQRAEAELRQALSETPGSPGACLLLGRLLNQNGKTEEAIPLLRKAAMNAPNDPAAPLELARLYTRLARPAEVTRWQTEAEKRQKYVTEQSHLVVALAKNPNDQTSLARLARLAAEHGEAEAALRHYALLLKVTADAPAALLAVAEGLHAGGYTAQTMTLAQRVMQHPETTAE